jgi:hypothetical protein
MKSPKSVDTLENFGRVQLSKSFFMRDFLYSEIAQIEKLINVPEDPDLAIAAGTALCKNVLEPIQDALGRIAIRSAFRSCDVNQKGNETDQSCARNEANYSKHIWDRRDSNGFMGATACIVVTSFLPYYEKTGDWQALAWWIHDNIPNYADLTFFPKLAAFNISWHEKPNKSIYSYIAPKGYLTKIGKPNFEVDHSHLYREFLISMNKI